MWVQIIDWFFLGLQENSLHIYCLHVSSHYWLLLLRFSRKFSACLVCMRVQITDWFFLGLEERKFSAYLLSELQGECRELICPELTELGNKSCHWRFQVAVGLCFEAYIQVFFNGTKGEDQHEPKENFTEQEEQSELINHQPVLKYFNKLFRPLDDYNYDMYQEIFFEDTDAHDTVSIVNLVVHVIFSRNISFINTLLSLEGEKIQTDGESKLDVTLLEQPAAFEAGLVERVAPPEAGPSEQNPTRHIVHSGT